MTTSTEATAERSRVAALPVEEKVRLLTGADSWRTYGAATLGLRPIVMSDGPAGVRGITKDDRNPSASIPCPSALGATWDSDLVREVAAAMAAEARDKGVNVVLAPTINLMRTPLGGRGFECFSEDPVLSARLAVGYVRGLRAGGVGAAVKHYVGNDSETERWTYDARISETVLREVYLVPFEACVREAGTAMVMAAYNEVNGARMTEHAWLLRDVLKGEWGFPGAVVSDWDAARSTVPAAQAGLDLVMPGPDGPWGEALIQAVRDGTVAEEVIDDKVLRLLEVARQVGALTPAAGEPGPPDGPADGPVAPGPRPTAPAGPADHVLLRRVAAASFTLLRNERATLPIDPAAAGRIALIGPNATHPVIQGGGSAAVHPAFVSTPADALRQALDGHASLTVSPGCHTWEAVPEPPAATITDPVTGQPGVRLEFRAADGTLLGSEHRASTVFAWWGDGLPAGIGWGEPGTVSVLASYTPQQSGPHVVGAAGVGRLRVTVDGAVAAQGDTPVPDDPVETMTRPGEITGQVEFTAGEAAEVRLDFLPSARGRGTAGGPAGHRGHAGRGSRAGPGGGGGRGGRRRGGGGRLRRDHRERGLRPADTPPARPPGRARRAGERGQPADRGGGERGHAGAHAMGRAGRRGAVRLAARPGHGRCAGRRAVRPGGAGRPAAGDHARRGGGLPGAARGAAGRAARLRRGPARRLPRVRHGGHRPAVPVRPRSRLHDVGVRVAVRGGHA